MKQQETRTAVDRTLTICVTVYASVSIFIQSGHTQSAAVNTESLVARINKVRVLAFDTDRPVREVRAVVDGKVVGTNRWTGTSKEIKVAVIRGTNDVSVEMQVGNVGGILEFPFPMNNRANVAEPESYGPGRQLKLDDWVELFSVKQVINSQDVLAIFRLEIR
jgi:hypothetical protein